MISFLLQTSYRPSSSITLLAIKMPARKYQHFAYMLYEKEEEYEKKDYHLYDLTTDDCERTIRYRAH